MHTCNQFCVNGFGGLDLWFIVAAGEGTARLMCRNLGMNVSR